MQLDAHVAVENLRKLLSELHKLAASALAGEGSFHLYIYAHIYLYIDLYL